MRKVLVLHPKDLTYVEKAVFEQSLKSMIGLCEEPRQDAAESQVSSAAADPQVADSAAQERPHPGKREEAALVSEGIRRVGGVVSA